MPDRSFFRSFVALSEGKKQHLGGTWLLGSPTRAGPSGSVAHRESRAHGTSWLPCSSIAIKASTGQTLHASITRSRSTSGTLALNAQIFSLSNSKISGPTFMQLPVLMHSVWSMRIVRPLTFRSTKSPMTVPPCVRLVRAHQCPLILPPLTGNPIQVSPLRTSAMHPRGDRTPRQL